MGRKDLSLKSYLSDPARYADVYNGSVFKGIQVLDGAQLEEAPVAAVWAEGDGALERACDIAMRQKADGGLYALWILENQETVDYGMPVRVLLREALEYDRQVKELRRRNKADYRNRPEKAIAGEYLYKVRRDDRIRPVSTLIVYWGDRPWDGPRSLHELLDFGGIREDAAQELKKLIPEYPLHILDLNESNDYSCFKTSLRTVFELYARRSDKREFLDYIADHKECHCLDMETHEVIGQLMGMTKLRSLQREAEEGERQDMWKAIEDLIEDGRQEGIQEGRQEGKREGRQAGEASQIISIIDSMMEKLHCTLEEACEYAGKTPEDYRQAKSLL